MPFDFKKEYKEFYLPPTKPSIVNVPPMNYIAVRGSGNPNDADGEYQTALEQRYCFVASQKSNNPKHLLHLHHKRHFYETQLFF